MDQKKEMSELIELVIDMTKVVKRKFSEQGIQDPEYFFWHKYIELLDKVDEVKSQKDMDLIAEANVLRLLSILAPHWKEFRKEK